MSVDAPPLLSYYCVTGSCFLCERPTSNKCPSCELVFYCCNDHLLAHRHQTYCFPFRVKWRTGAGRCLVATRDIKAMELILIDAAIAHGPPNMTSPVCLECGHKVDGSYLCGMCNLPMCGEACQVGPTHYNECQVLRTLKQKISVKNFQDSESPIYQCITPLRLLMKKNTHPKWFRRLVFLMDHKEEREQETNMWNEHQKNVVDFLLSTCNLNFTKEDVMWAIGVLKTNSIMFGDEKSRALFPIFSLINHSCVANAKHTIYIKNRRIAVQAQTDIKEGEEIVINYTTFIMGTVPRRKKLLHNWYFSCQCPRCRDPTELGSQLSSLVCPKCEQVMVQTDPLQPDSPWRCPRHSFSYSAAHVSSLVTDLRAHFLSLGKDNGATLEGLEATLIMFSSFLVPTHHLMMIIKRKTVTSSQLSLLCTFLNNLFLIEYFELTDNCWASGTLSASTLRGVSTPSTRGTS